MIVLESKRMELLVLPEVGGKIGQIRDKDTGYELLIPPQRPYKTIAPGESWLDHDTSGMDDCFPNIAAGPYPFEQWTGILLPDLGEWTHGTWQLGTVTNSEIALERTGELLPYFARKRITIAGDRALRFSYHVKNTGKAPFRYMWSAHPLISVPAGFELVLPPGAAGFRVFPFDNELYRWPHFGITDLSRSWIPEGQTLKIFVTGLSEGWCVLRQRHCTMRFTFDLGATPVLGLWFNNAGFPDAAAAPFRCIAVEPCTSASDLLDALPPDAYPVVEPGCANEWSVEVEIEDTGLPPRPISRKKESG
jgi:hypothetical protein